MASMIEERRKEASRVTAIQQVQHNVAFRGYRQYLGGFGTSGTIPIWKRAEVANNLDLSSSEYLVKAEVNASTNDLFCLSPNFPTL